MDKSISMLLVGIGGYGKYYVERLMEYQGDDMEIAGVVDIKPESSNVLKRKGIAFYTSMEEFYQHGKQMASHIYTNSISCVVNMSDFVHGFECLV